MTTIAEIAGMDHRSATRLRKAGIRTAEALVENARRRDRLGVLSEQTGIESETLSQLAAAAGLMSLEGIGGRYSALLKVAGIHSVAQLARRSPEEVVEALGDANHRTRMIRRMPTPEEVGSWVIQASAAEGG